MHFLLTVLKRCDESHADLSGLINSGFFKLCQFPVWGTSILLPKLANNIFRRKSEITRVSLVTKRDQIIFSNFTSSPFSHCARHDHKFRANILAGIFE